ncbi:hypothetical protein I5R92_18220 [Pseudomonas carnis]|jgi:hypothetical protein|uniref:Rop family plasmid primer RNA-binding protein n=1 Tax=Pseudomonas lactis TaxID=1615674 RepID=A0A7Y1MFI6_9PSED|nr:MULTISPECIES: hypothetical protein [Pseudomonas]MBH3369222.1 hypothetical protein [Pseudomonas carnis]MBJ2287348.1 hypothetical protein [Pseudomonas sp. MF6755]NNA80900.1 hypothetical protein [Pseudomonas lactis]CAH0169375.1 hypothetical protein SRABI08_01139 [Pseudomonas carnis]CAH0261685.1 hypothetical protein SRABI111_03424 [Pseudomonas carnis]
MGDLIQDMANVLEDGTDDAPLAFFEACEDLQLQVTQLMHATFLAVQQKPEPKL